MPQEKRDTLDKGKWMFGGTLCASLCIAGLAWGQIRHSEEQSAGKIITPLPPAARAKMEKSGHLAQAALKAIEAEQYAEAEDDARQSLSFGYASGVAQELLAASLNAQGKTQEALQAYKVIADAGDVYPRNQVPYALLLLK